MTDSQPAPSLTLTRPRPRRRRVGPTLFKIAGGALLLAGLAAGWRYARPQAVATWTVSRGPLDVALTGPATLDAIDKAFVSSRVSGRLTRILVDRNAGVAAGQVVAIVEQDDLRGAVSVARANLDAAQGAVREAEATLVSGRATLANARTAFDREAALRANGWVAQARLDQARATLHEAEARVAALVQSVDRARAQAEAAAASLSVDEAQLGFATVRAPFAGVVVARSRTVGDVLTPGASILEIVDPASIVLTARFDESVIGAVRPGQAAHISFASSPDHDLGATVLRMSRQVDPETREFTVDLGPATLPVSWALGQRAEVRIIIAHHPAALTVPQAFVARRDGRTGVWVARHGRARWTDVDFADSQGDRLEVRGGLAAGDRVVAPQDAYPFMPVAPAGKEGA